jgi:hypothetical protein
MRLPLRIACLVFVLSTLVLIACASPTEQATNALKNTPVNIGASGDIGKSTPDITNVAELPGPLTVTPRPKITRLPITSPTSPNGETAGAPVLPSPLATPTPIVGSLTGASVSPAAAVAPVSSAQLVNLTPMVDSSITASVSQPTPTASPKPAQPLKLVAKGFGSSNGGTQVGYSFLVENPNTALAVENTSFQVAAYDAAGDVVKTDQGYITLILPGQHRGVGGNLFLPKGMTVVRIDVQLQPKSFVASSVTATFTSDKVLYVPDKYFPKVTGVIQSPYKQDMNQVSVSAVAFDSNGNITGGGLGYVNFVPAGGQTAVEVLVQTAGVPTRVELYAGFSALTLLDLQQQGAAVVKGP